MELGYTKYDYIDIYIGITPHNIGIVFVLASSLLALIEGIILLFSP